MVKKVRAAIRAAAPGAIDHFSYGIPGFRFEGRPLLWYAGWKTHVSMYPVTAAMKRAHDVQLRRYRTGKGTLRFPLDDTPIPLVTKLAKTRAREIRAALLGVVMALTLTACDYVRPIESVCEARLKPTEIHVTTVPVTYATDLTLPGSRLTQMAPQGVGRAVHGLTHTTMRSEVSMAANGITNPVSRKHCLRPVIGVKLAFEPMTVYIGSEQAEGSCQFGVTMQHELQHVAVYRTFLTSAGAEIEKQLRDYFGNRIFYFDNEADAEKRINRETNERIGPFVEESMRRISEMQAPLDTREEYDRLERSCSDP